MKTGDANRQPYAVSRVITAIFVVFLACLVAVALFWRAEYCSYRHGDNPAWIPQNGLLLLATAGFIFCISLAIYRFGSRLNQGNRRYVTGNVLYISLAIQVLYILLLPAEQFADQSIVNTIAQDLIKGNFRAFRKGGYLYQYPNNIGITLALSVVYRLFPRSMLVPKLLNAIFSTITSYLIMRIYEESNPAKRGKSYGILLFSGFFLPMILLNNLVYNDIYATTLFAAGTYYAVRFLGSQKWCHLLLCSFFIALGNFLRMLGPIFLLAVILYLAIKRTGVAKILALAGITMALFLVPPALVNCWLIREGKITEPVGENSVPIHMWIHMGMNDKKFGYWDDGYSYGIYLREGYQNKKRSAEIYSQMIRKRLQGKNLVRTLGVYVKKNLWLWTEGTYQAEYYGVGSWGYLYPTFVSALFEHNYAARDFLRWVMHAGNYMRLVTALYGLAASLREGKSYPLMLPVIIILGFVGFYTLWEIKPRYIYPAYPYLVLVFYYGIEKVSGRFFADPPYRDDPSLAREENTFRMDE